ncbi:hypothetical protein [uncultured Aquitalea sp.]|uniref:hypothetical protein n=1 Tax=uncultured Aquitalea sp. TaxID=540272 RepID=UPI0025E79129|nr:hypothetical protein [uncultured Aquitalea sp.]
MERIQKGQQATFLPMNAVILQALRKVNLAVGELSRRGFTVTTVEMDAPSRPTVRIQSSARCHELIASGQAAYFGFGNGEMGRYREGQFTLDGCRVVWTENGH